MACTEKQRNELYIFERLNPSSSTRSLGRTRDFMTQKKPSARAEGLQFDQRKMKMNLTSQQRAWSGLTSN